MFTTTRAQPTRSISPIVVAGAGTTAAVVGLTAVVFAVRLAPMSFVVVAALLPLSGAAIVDAAERRLPNRLVLLSIAPVAFVCALDPFIGRLTAVEGVALGAVFLAAPLLALHLIAPTSMGFGDVKAAAALGAALGLIQPELALWTLCLASAITATWGIARRARHVALGPGLVVAAFTVLLAGAWFGIEVSAWH